MNRIKTSSQFNEAYAYDQRDNRSTLQSDQVPDIKGASYAYDSRNRLTQVTTEDGKAVSYRYNGDNLMVERTEGGVTTRYYYNDRAKIVAEGRVEGNGSITITASYVHDSDGKLLARQVPGQGMQYYVSNGHGDITEIRDAQGNVLNRYTYDIWGNPLVQEEQVPNIFRYSGEYWDAATSLQYLRARWYDPSIGRFINEDTYEGELGNPLTLNLYTYVQNNPLKYIDPSGNRYIPSEMNSILEATMKITSTESKAYSYAYNLLSREYADVYDNNRFNYLFGLLTQTSAYKNSAGNADWARAELAKDYSKWHQDISFAEALASLGPIIGGIGKAREVGGKAVINLPETRWIKHDVYNELKRLQLDKKFVKAKDMGYAKARKGADGIIDLSQNEIVKYKGYTYNYKIKVAGAPNHVRVYGRIDENGAMVFDYMTSGKK
ncbi:RHS repeat-associated core domain-containing protein [Paenibacillus alvei]|uniref:RHS repeat domain-containing protein n=2 Tax=Paenibacillus alvei TaxID=44250 RepID=UPI0002885AD9|nr:RHS repeat-associated core domain-containing protein [Paenibacillus alvei]EJW14601.1 Rhs family protein [Paenibacillus alvei DSM 29]MCY9706390.1 RHS repeat-associated core domain-containing protein [Paenibacillus alvei]MCY9737180.1 RHS repeat-associated core domain-containing protein [Paenibacillus alvei]